MRLWNRGPTVPLGVRRFLWIFRRTLRITPRQAEAHMHVLGKTGSGKSYFLAGLFLAFHEAGMPVTLIDPHGDLAELVLTHLVASGTFRDPKAFERIIYLDIPAAAAAGRYLPFNYLEQPYDDHAMAELIAEACRRAWPELATGAPTFENILKHSVIVLRQNNLPLTELANLLTDKAYRERLLVRVSDPQVVRFFHMRLDQWGRDEAHMKESTLNRADLLTLSPVLRYSLGTKENRLSFRKLMDTGKSLIVNLALPHHDARRLFGCLMTVGMEMAALSRADNRTSRRPHHLMIDEFSQFMSQSETSLTRMLSETRKYGLFSIMSHQNWTQASEKLKGALQNVGVEVILKSGRMDAEYSARVLGSVNPMEVKHTIEDDSAEVRSHPAYMSLPEQWEKQVQAIQRLRVGEALVRLADDSVHKIRTKTLRALRMNRGGGELSLMRAKFLDRYFTEPAAVVQECFRTPGAEPLIGRRPLGARGLHAAIGSVRPE
jgi:type IV secretion system coupling TraD/TrwB family protein